MEFSGIIIIIIIQKRTDTEKIELSQVQRFMIIEVNSFKEKETKIERMRKGK